MLARTAKGRALVNLLSLADGERVSNCLNVREFPDDRYLIMATASGLVKKTALSAYSRPMKGGIIAIQLNEGDELINVRIVSGNDDVVLGTRNGMSFRFSHHDARAMGRNTRGVNGIRLAADDKVVGMVVADPTTSLLTVCENGYGKRTPFGYADSDGIELTNGESLSDDAEEPENNGEEISASDREDDNGETSDSEVSSAMRYRRQKRGGKGLKDIKTTKRNGPVVSLIAVNNDDHILMMTAGGKIQRFRASDIREIGRNTQGVRLIRLDDTDRVAALARIPAELAEPDESDEPTTIPDEG